MYLTEETLFNFLKSVYPNEEIICNKGFKESGLNCRPDFRIPNIKLIVEFDGYQHYTLAKVAHSDSIKTETFENIGYKVIRIPYFVQLSKESIKFYFGIDIEYTQNYPHGFIDNKAILPADFCSLGLKRFSEEMTIIPKQIREEIINSLDDKIKILGKNLVLPIN